MKRTVAWLGREAREGMQEVKLIMGCRAKESSVFDRLNYVEEFFSFLFLFALDCVRADQSYRINTILWR